MTRAVGEDPSGDGKFVTFLGPWTPIYMAFCIVASLIPFLAVFAMGFSVADDEVFAVVALIGGWMGDRAFIRVCKRSMVAFPGSRIKFIYVWPVVALMAALGVHHGVQ